MQLYHISPHLYIIQQFLSILSSDSILHFFCLHMLKKGGGEEEGVS